VNKNISVPGDMVTFLGLFLAVWYWTKLCWYSVLQLYIF